MRRHVIMQTVGDRTYYSYWSREHNMFTLFVRPRLPGGFHKRVIGRWKIKGTNPGYHPELWFQEARRQLTETLNKLI